MPSLLDGAAGERMEVARHYQDFQENYAKATEFWKLERGQFFAEPGNPSWEAFDSGDWAESMRLIEQTRGGLVEYFRENAARGMVSRRVRVASLPPTDYLHWELVVLRLRDESGGPIRVLLEQEVAGLEHDGQLPDMYTLDDRI